MDRPRCDKCGGEMISVFEPATFACELRCKECEVELKSKSGQMFAVPRESGDSDGNEA